MNFLGKCPFLLIGIPFIIGIITGYVSDVYEWLIYTLIGLGLFLFILKINKLHFINTQWTGLFLLMLGVGILCSWIDRKATDNEVNKINNRQLVAKVEVVSDVRWNDKGMRFFANIDTIYYDSFALKSTIKVWLSSKEKNELTIGDNLIAQIHINNINNSNYQGFANYLRGNGTFTMGYIKNIIQIEKIIIIIIMNLYLYI